MTLVEALLQPQPGERPTASDALEIFLLDHEQSSQELSAGDGDPDVDSGSIYTVNDADQQAEEATQVTESWAQAVVIWEKWRQPEDLQSHLGEHYRFIDLDYCRLAGPNGDSVPRQ